MKVEHFTRWDQRARPKNYRESVVGIKRCEVKLDGFRVTVCREGNKNIFAVGRKTEGADLWPKMMECLVREDIAALSRMPEKTVLDGELFIPNDFASSVSHILASGKAEARFQPFAAPFVAGVDCRSTTFADRDKMLAHLRFQPPQELSMWPSKIEDLSALADEMKVEGFVLKQAHYRGWYKVKRNQTVDAIVIGAEPGKGKHRGRLGALHLAVMRGDDMVKCGKVGIGNDAEWRDCDAVEILGRVVEVLHEGVQSNGALRFPRFIRWRDDKTPIDCDVSQLVD
tara:strand:+ start:3150 stop:4001 length:852 start_codon:yes stop_codon:yes gene_type:complete